MFEFIVILITSLLITSTKNSRIDWKADSLLNSLVDLKKLRRIQNTSKCPLNSTTFEGACYWVSDFKLTWDEAEKACSLWHNGSLAVINSMRELNFIANQVTNKSNPVDRYLFIGLRDRKGYLSWLNGIPLAQSELSIIYEPYRPRRFRCGLLLIFNDNERAIEQRSCDFDSYKFVCKYVLDSCYNNSKCYPGGTCVNFGNNYVCRCRFMYDGFHCDQWSSAAIQSMISAIIVIIGLTVWCVLSVDLNKRIFDAKNTYRRICGT